MNCFRKAGKSTECQEAALASEESPEGVINIHFQKKVKTKTSKENFRLVNILQISKIFERILFDQIYFLEVPVWFT